MNDKTVLITRGTGSFGRTMLKRFLSDISVSRIRIFGRGEEKQDRMRREFSGERVRFYIRDVRDYASVFSGNAKL